MRFHTGPASWNAYVVIVATAPSVVWPWESSHAPHTSAATGAIAIARSIPGNSTVRSPSVYRSASNASVRSARTRARRRSASESASTVRAPSTLSVIVPLSVAYAAASRW